MCRAIDAAKTLINLSIELAEQNNGDESYYIDIYKIHKLLYFAQKQMYEKYEKPMFVDNIERHYCGPLIDDLYNYWFGYDLIKSKIPKDSFFPVTPDRLDVLRDVLKKYHNVSVGKMVYDAKNDPDYNKYTVPKQDRKKVS